MKAFKRVLATRYITKQNAALPIYYIFVIIVRFLYHFDFRVLQFHSSLALVLLITSEQVVLLTHSSLKTGYTDKVITLNNIQLILTQITSMTELMIAGLQTRHVGLM